MFRRSDDKNDVKERQNRNCLRLFFSVVSVRGVYTEILEGVFVKRCVEDGYLP